ncbi:MAG: FAD-binding oxidoreductase [Planctomycetaceae bacterium]|nr:FAD-binding oxidoreductase [Planctomycetaceae bacterium]MBP62487.1 FAD-binding oxidoreductase [Planctomycetaceae bacterium]
MNASKLFEQLRRLYPPDRLLTRPAQLAPYESDGLTAFRARPAGIVLPETQDEVIQTVKLCYQHEIPFMARGSGTSLSGGSVPIQDGLLIGLNRMNRILQYEPKQRIAVVEPGVINLAVSQRATFDNLYYAPDPSSGPVCTLGGNVAFNSGGAHCLKYGMTSNHVLGLKVVLPNGEVCQLGGDSLEMVGPDMTGMFVGSEGLFGVALEITLRLLPKPEVYYTVQAAYDSLAKAGDAVTLVVASGLLPGAMEIMDRLSLDAADAAVGAGYPSDAKAILIVELEGIAEEVEAEKPRLHELIEKSGAYLVEVAKDDEQRLKIWTGRKSAFSAVGRLSPDFIVQDGVVPRTKLGESLVEIDRLSREYDIRVANVFHAGDGNLHPLIMYDGRQSGALERAECLAGEILRHCIRLGGSITGEHGVGLEKRGYMREMFGESDLEFMFELRHAVDPLQLANRGKMLPMAESPVLTTRGAHPLEKQGIISRE